MSYSQKDVISLLYFSGRGLTEEMLAEGVRIIAGVADSDAELDLGQLEYEITRKCKRSLDLRVCEQAFAVQLKVQEFLHNRKLSAVFVPNGRWAKGPGTIVARVILAGLTPPGFRDNVRRRMQFKDASSEPYRVLQLTEEMSRKKWAAIDEYQCGACSSGRGGWRQPRGDQCHSSPRGEAHSPGTSERPIGDHKKKKCSTREAKATEDGPGEAGGRGPLGGRAPSGSSRPTTSSDGVVRPGTGTQEPADRTRWQQQLLQPPAFNTRSRNNMRQTEARAVQVAPVPAEKLASDAPACAPGTEAARPAPGRWLWVPDDDSPAVDRGAAASSSGGAVRAPEAEAKPSLEGAAGTSHPPFISCIGVDAVASVREGQVDVEFHQFHCLTGIMVPGGEDSESYMIGTVLDSGAGISCVSEVTVCALQRQFPGVDVVQPYGGEQHQVVLADGRAVPIERQTCSLTAAIMTPWAPVIIWLALAVMPEEDNLLILRSKTLREKLSIDVMKQLRDTAAASGGGASIMEHAPAEVPAMPPKIIGVHRVAVTTEEMQLADIEGEAAGETNGLEDVLLDREPDMMMSFSDRDIQQREQVLEDAILRAARAGMPPDDLA